MPRTDDKLKSLLEPIFRDHADAVEVILPPQLRARWRAAVAFARQARGRKPLDHRALLLEMAEADTDGTRPPRALAISVAARFPDVPGAGADERGHVRLPDGSSPARRDLVDRLARDYASLRPALRMEVAGARSASERVGKRLACLAGRGKQVPAVPRPQVDPALAEKLRSLRAPVVTAYQLDQVRAVVARHGRKSRDAADQGAPPQHSRREPEDGGE